MTSLPRLILAGLSGGAGKTLASLGLARAWTAQGRRVKPFKKGPDYIDAAWLAMAAKAAPANLDPWIMDPAAIAPLFADRMHGFDLGLVEGNRGLFDGMDLSGSCSTAELSRLLAAPVVLVLDGTKMTRTAAAIVMGCKNFEPGLNLAGVIVNRCAGERHRAMLRQAIGDLAGVPVLGMLPKLGPDPIPERHMGLVSDKEFGGGDAVLDRLAQVVAESVDLDALWSLARDAGPIPGADQPCPWPEPAVEPGGVVIGCVRDAALWFYYEENLEALRRAGAEVVEVSLLDGEPWPELHGLYLGGGFPETLAAELSAQRAKRDLVRSLADSGMPVYAECGGFMYLGRSVTYEGITHELSGVLPLCTEVHARPQGLGYVEAEVVAENSFFAPGTVLKGHEFHYSGCTAQGELRTALRIRRGQGMGQGCDGVVQGNVFAAYTHIHALGGHGWAGNFVRAATAFKERA